MEIKAYSDIQHLNNSIDYLLSNSSWTDVSVEKLDQLIHLNLKLITSQTENMHTAPELQQKLMQLSDRINLNFSDKSAHRLAFELQGIAQGIFSKNKVDIKSVPTDVLHLILKEITPSGVPKDRVISSGLENPRLASHKLKLAAENTKKAWANEEGVSLKTCGCKTADEAVEYIIKNGFTNANLSEFKDLTDEHLSKLGTHCRNLNHLSINSNHITDNGIECLKGLKLTSVDFSKCGRLTNDALKHLKGMPLTSVEFSWCRELTDEALIHLKGMPLTSVNFNECELTNEALVHLKGMPLTSVNFSDCVDITDEALVHLKGMALTNVDFSGCALLTNKALEHLKEMPLTNVNFSGCTQLTDEALVHLKEMRLTSVSFYLCDKLTDKALECLKEMPLTNIDLHGCRKLNDSALQYLKGMPLESVNFRSTPVTLSNSEILKRYS